MKSFKLYLLIIFLSIFPLIDIFRTSLLPHTSDGAMHIVRFASFYKEVMAGQILPKWAGQLDYGYGMPLFVFYNPLAYVIGFLFIKFGLSLIATLKVSFVITYILAGIFTLLFCRKYFKDDKTAFFVTVMYQYSPFRLVEMLTRGNLGSLYSYAILPLVFYSIISFLSKKTYFNFLLLAASIALLPLSHTIIGLLFFGMAILFVIFITQDVKKIFLTYFSMLVGVALSSFFIIPAIIEHKYTNGYIFSKNLFYLHFPKFYTFFVPNITNLPQLRTAEISVQIGLFHVLAFIILIFLLIKNKIIGKEKLLAIYILIVSIATLLMMNPITKIIWEKVSIIRQFEFPWRLLAIICFTSALASSFAISKLQFLRKNIVYSSLILLIILSTVYYWSPYQGYQNFKEDYFWNFPGTTTYFAEINTIWMASEPTEFPKKRIDIVAGKARILNIKLSSINHEYLVEAENNSTIVDKTFFYPGWKVTVDEKPVKIQFQDQNYRGLITFNVSTGKHKVRVFYTEDKLQRFSDVISILIVLSLAIGAIACNGFKKKK